ncbi:MAG: hypothetical protein ACOC2C_06235 [Cyclonatronaceae bacterium]
MSFLFLLPGCENGLFKSGPPLKEETYVQLIAEFELLRHATEIQQEQNRTEDLPPEDLLQFVPETLKRDILRHYEVSEQELRDAHAYYAQDIGEQKRRYREAIDRVNEAHSKLSGAQKQEDESTLESSSK